MKRRSGHVPVRLCVGCNERDAKASLDRFALEGRALLWGGRAGRGAYLHRRASCRSAFLSRKARIRSLRATIDRDRREALLSTGAGIES